MVIFKLVGKTTDWDKFLDGKLKADCYYVPFGQDRDKAAARLFCQLYSHGGHGVFSELIEMIQTFLRLGYESHGDPDKKSYREFIEQLEEQAGDFIPYEDE